MKFASLIVSAGLALAATAAHALELKPYSAAALDDAQQAGRPVALHFHADWCPTCRAQQQVLNALTSDPGLELTVLIADYDDEKALKRRFNIRSQSTLVVLRGHRESARLVGETAPEAIRAALKSAL